MNPRLTGESRKLIIYQALCALLSLILLVICLRWMLTSTKSSSNPFISSQSSPRSSSAFRSSKESTTVTHPDLSPFQIIPFWSWDSVDTSTQQDGSPSESPKESERSTGYKSTESTVDAWSGESTATLPKDHLLPKPSISSTPSPSSNDPHEVDFEPEMVADIDFDALDRSFGAISSLALNIFDKFNPFTFTIEDGNEDTIMEPDFNIRSSFDGSDSIEGEETFDESPLTQEQLAYVNIYRNLRKILDF